MNAQFIVDEAALRGNVRVLRQMTSARILQVVKANAYGHGLEQITRILVSEGIDALGVVNVEEAGVIRSVDEQIPIYILGVVPQSDFAAAIDRRCVIPVWRQDQLQWASDIATETGIAAHLQIKVDTGMGRLGVLPEGIQDLLNGAQAYPSINISTIYTHFSLADDIGPGSIEAQTASFRRAVADAEEVLGYELEQHIANSPAFLRDPATHLHMVRIGILGYGISPAEHLALPAGITPIGSWTSTVEEIKVLPAGHGISYGSEYHTPHEMTVGIVPVGYADGFHRFPQGVNTVAVGGHEVPVLGRVCMDHIVISLESVEDCQIGDRVTLLGSGPDFDLSAQVLAKRWGTNEYDVVANIGGRVARILS